MTVEEEDGAERLGLGGVGDFSFNDKVGEEEVDMPNVHIPGVEGDLSAVYCGVVVADVFADPPEVGLFGAG